MGGGAIYEGLPHPHPTTSYWQSPPSKLAHHRSTRDLPKTAQYVIVGSGLTGTSVATKLLQQQPGADIVILEARTTCSGATGRNGGHCRPGFGERFKELYEKHGPEEVLKIENFEINNVKNLTRFIRKEGIQCELQPVETAGVWSCEDEFAQAVESMKIRAKVRRGNDDDFLNYKLHYGQDARDYFKMPNIAGGMTHNAYTLYPYKLVCSMVERLLAAGVNLQTTTPVLSVHRNNNSSSSSEQANHYPWTVETERGNISAGKVILATNAYTGALYKPLAETGSLIPTRGQVAALRPGSRIAGDPVLKRSAVLVGGGGLDDYMMSRPCQKGPCSDDDDNNNNNNNIQHDGDIVYGGGRLLSKSKEQFTVDDSAVNRTIAAYLRGAPQKYFGPDAWGERGRTVAEWTGIMGYTKDTLPFIGEVPSGGGDDSNRSSSSGGGGGSGLFVCAGFHGHGMPTTFQAAQGLVDNILDGKPPGWLPRAFRVERIFE